MNYAGHEKLRADVAEVANTMCDLRARLNDMEHRCRFDSDVLVERLMRIFMKGDHSITSIEIG